MNVTAATHVPTRPIWVIGSGARTPVGLTAESAAAAVRAGISGIAEHPTLLDRDGEPMRVCADAMLAANMPIVNRLQELLLSALTELPDLATLQGAALRTLIVLGVPDPRPGLPNNIADFLGRFVMERFARGGQRVRTLVSGHAAGVQAFGVAAKAIDDGEADAAIVAGVNSYLAPTTLRWMDETGQLKSALNRDGFFPGEASGACLLLRDDQVKALDREPIALLRAVSTAVEPIPMAVHGLQGVCVGEGLSAAFLGLAPIAATDGDQITDTYCDLNGQRYRSEELVYTILRAQQLWVEPTNYAHPADCWGDVGAASGPLFAVLACAASRKKYALGRRAAYWASSEGGRRAIAVLDFPRRE